MKENKVKLVRQVREQTDVRLEEAVKALEHTQWDTDSAIAYCRENKKEQQNIPPKKYKWLILLISLSIVIGINWLFPWHEHAAQYREMGVKYSVAYGIFRSMLNIILFRSIGFILLRVIQRKW